MRRLAAALAGILLLTTPVLAQQLGGSYAVQGKNLDGSAYDGEAQIVLLSETTCEISWVTGSTTSKGICMRHGDVFAASYVLGADTGLVIYRIMADGALVGVWTVAGQGGVGEETLIPKR